MFCAIVASIVKEKTPYGMEPSSQFSVECLQLFVLLGVRGTFNRPFAGMIPLELPARSLPSRVRRVVCSCCVLPVSRKPVTVWLRTFPN